MWTSWELKSQTEVRDLVGAFEMSHRKIRGTFPCGNNVMQIQIFGGKSLKTRQSYLKLHHISSCCPSTLIILTFGSFYFWFLNVEGCKKVSPTLKEGRGLQLFKNIPGLIMTNRISLFLSVSDFLIG